MNFEKYIDENYEQIKKRMKENYGDIKETVDLPKIGVSEDKYKTLLKIIFDDEIESDYLIDDFIIALNMLKEKLSKEIAKTRPVDKKFEFEIDIKNILYKLEKKIKDEGVYKPSNEPIIIEEIAESEDQGNEKLASEMNEKIITRLKNERNFILELDKNLKINGQLSKDDLLKLTEIVTGDKELFDLGFIFIDSIEETFVKNGPVLANKINISDKELASAIVNIGNKLPKMDYSNYAGKRKDADDLDFNNYIRSNYEKIKQRILENKEYINNLVYNPGDNKTNMINEIRAEDYEKIVKIIFGDSTLGENRDFTYKNTYEIFNPLKELVSNAQDKELEKLVENLYIAMMAASKQPEKKEQSESNNKDFSDYVKENYDKIIESMNAGDNRKFILNLGKNKKNGDELTDEESKKLTKILVDNDSNISKEDLKVILNRLTDIIFKVPYEDRELGGALVKIKNSIYCEYNLDNPKNNLLERIGEKFKESRAKRKETPSILTISYSDLKQRLEHLISNNEININFLDSDNLKNNQKYKLLVKIILGKDVCDKIDVAQFKKMIVDVIRDFHPDTNPKDINVSKDNDEILKFLTSSNTFLKKYVNDNKKQTNNNSQKIEISYTKRTPEEENERNEIKKPNITNERSLICKNKDSKSLIAYEKSLKKYSKLVAGLAGFGIGLGAAAILPTATVGIGGAITFTRLAYSTGKFVNKVVSKKFLNGEPTVVDKIINKAKDKIKNLEVFYEESIDEKTNEVVETNTIRFSDTGLYRGIKKINDFFKKPEVQWFINGAALGYRVGKFLDIHDKLFASEPPKTQSIVQSSTSDLTTGAEATPEVTPSSTPSYQSELQGMSVSEKADISRLASATESQTAASSDFSWLNTGDNIDLSGVTEGFTNSYSASTGDGAVSLITDYASLDNGTFIKSLRLPDGSTFTGNIGELLDKGINPSEVAARVANQNGDYAWLNLEDILETYAETAKNTIRR